MYELGLVVISGIFAFILSFAIGANDVANALGTSVGSKALTVYRAILLAAVFEFLGVATMGQFVSGTLKSSIISPVLFTGNSTVLFSLGMSSTLAGSAVWLLVATYLALPVSTTQTIVGGIVGFASIEKGFEHINWLEILNIVISWVVSPVMGGVVGFLLYLSIKKLIFDASEPYRVFYVLFPFYSSITLSVLTSFGLGSIFKLFEWPWWVQLLVSVVVFVVSLIVLFLFVMPMFKKKDIEYDVELAGSLSDESSILIMGQEHRDAIENKFKYLMILSAVFVSYAHGGNDVANSIGPFSAVLEYGMTGDITTNGSIPWYVIIGGGIGIDLGLAILGHKVMHTVGEKITKLSFTRGYCAQFSAALTVLIATVFGLPISTTSVLVGGIAGTGLVKEHGEGGVDTTVLLKIMAGWIFTIIAGYTLTSIIYFTLRAILI